MSDDLKTREQLLGEVRGLRASLEARLGDFRGRGTPLPDGLTLHDVFDRLFGFIGLLAPDGTVLDVNRSPLEATGLRREEVVGRTFWDTGWWNRCPGVREQLRADFAEALAGRPVHREATYFTAAGEERVVDRTLTPVEGAERRIALVVAEGRDVTDRRRAEEARPRGERRVQAMIEHQFDGISLNAADGTVLYLSPSARRHYGLDERDVVGRPPAEFTHPDDQDRAARAHAEVLRSPRTPVRFEYRVRHGGGPWRWVEVVAQNLLDEPGVGAIVCNYRDITDQRRAEDARRESEARFRGLFHQSTAGMAEVDLSGQFALVNQQFCELVGRTAAELSRLRMQDITHPDDLPQNLELFERAGRDREPFVIEKRYVRPDGSHVWARSSVTAIRNAAGTPQSVLAVAIDVTARRLAEECVRQARDELECRVRERTAELEMERARLAEAFRLAPSFMAVLRGPNHVFERANDRYHELVGRRDIIGRPVREALPEVAGQGYFELLDRVYTTGEPFCGKGMRIRVSHMPGAPPEELVLDFVYQPLRGGDGAVSGILVQGIDQTDRVRAEESLREQAELLDLAADAIIIHDPQGAVTYWNRGAERLYGWARDETLGRNADELLGTTYPRPREGIVAQVTGAGYWAGDLAQTRRDGSAVVVASRWTRRAGEGGLATVLEINTDVTELRQGAKVREEFVGRLLAAQEQERRNVARELHDGVAQSLTALHLRIGIMAQQASRPEVRDGLAELTRIARAAAEEVRFLARGLRPPALDELGLFPALTRYADDFARAHGIRAEVVASGRAGGRLPPVVETAFYRIAQEALANVARHSGAASVSIVLLREPSFVQLLVEDDGAGWDPASEPADAYAQLGLQGMRERAALLGGRLTIESSPGSGTAVCARIPLPEGA
jgi:PAS domain S-box-containing protein